MGGRALLVALAAWSADAAALSCTVSASATHFGTYSPFDPVALDGAGNVQVTCGNLVNILVSYTVALSTGSSGSHAARRMSNGPHLLTYNLYTNAGRSTVWGDGSGGSSVVAESYLLLLLSDQRSYPVYARIPAGQNVAPGSYADTIVITVNY